MLYPSVFEIGTRCPRLAPVRRVLARRRPPGGASGSGASGSGVPRAAARLGQRRVCVRVRCVCASVQSVYVRARPRDTVEANRMLRREVWSVCAVGRQLDTLARTALAPAAPLPSSEPSFSFIPPPSAKTPLRGVHYGGKTARAGNRAAVVESNSLRCT